MPLTKRQGAFVMHRIRGATNRDAALKAGYSAASADVAGARLARTPKIAAAITDGLKAQSREPDDATTPSRPPTDDPKLYLMAVMNDPTVDLRLRSDAAKALLPFVHAKPAHGKRAAAAEAASKAATGGRFKAAQAPAGLLKLVTPQPLKGTTK